MTSFKIKFGNKEHVIYQNGDEIASTSDTKEAVAYIAHIILKERIKNYEIKLVERGDVETLENFNPQEVLKNTDYDFDDDDDSDDDNNHRRGRGRNRHSDSDDDNNRFRRNFSRRDRDREREFEERERETEQRNVITYTPRHNTRENWENFGLRLSDALNNSLNKD